MVVMVGFQMRQEGFLAGRKMPPDLLPARPIQKRKFRKCAARFAPVKTMYRKAKIGPGCADMRRIDRCFDAGTAKCANEIDNEWRGRIFSGDGQAIRNQQELLDAPSACHRRT